MFFGDRVKHQPWQGVIIALILALTMCGCSHTNKATIYEGEPIELSFPFKSGTFYIAEGGSTRASNYHYWSSFFKERGMQASVRYAVDIDKVGADGNNVVNGKLLNDYPMYGEPLYSPIDGIVVYLEDGHPDMPVGWRDMSNPRGNHIVIRQDDVYVVMLHLLPGSIVIEVGEEVTAGKFLGQIGNSGATSRPHLHIQAARGSTWFGEGVPMLFDGRFLVKGDIVKSGTAK